ncbi:hypothetical protein ABEW34_27725 [Paenibacillus algorifonticola]|uniref:hypothetical protein n=1 Tax=Paenibacillus algorifonticola TaxID=684063 RepID=UPI003D2A9956
MRLHYRSSWEDLIAAAYSDTRERFKTKFGNVHRGKNDAVDCRITDIAANAKSPIATTPISMNGMLLGSRRLLLNVMDSATIYPFTARKGEKSSRLYEVYPSNGWSRLGLNREELHDIQRLPDVFKVKIDPDFHISFNSNLIPLEQRGQKAGKANQHATDAMMACLTLAYCQMKYGIDDDWGHKPAFASAEEWQLIRQEGLIVRM